MKRMLLLGAALLGGACRDDGSTAPAEVGYLVPYGAQCVASRPTGAAAGGPTVESRLAPLLLPGQRDAVACLTRDGTRWRLAPLPTAGAEP